MRAVVDVVVVVADILEELFFDRLELEAPRRGVVEHLEPEVVDLCLQAVGGRLEGESEGGAEELQELLLLLLLLLLLSLAVVAARIAGDEGAEEEMVV
jgi:hypothetical protein